MTIALNLEGQDVQRMARYRELLEFNNGQQWSTRRRAGETRLVFNYARVLVRKSVSYLMPVPVTFDVVPDVSTGQLTSALEATIRLAERALAEVYERHDQAAIDFQSALDAAVLGDGAFKVTWDARQGMPLVVPVDPGTLWAWWEPVNPGAVYRVVQRYTVSADEATRLFDVPARTHRRGRVSIIEDWRADRYRVEIDGEPAIDQKNPYGWIPYVI